ncbi:hypothetical protein FRC02_011892 [Tulasnella sp. 418]|nr:hypothetical protein FRC02_011892 [Tulasnella sp. 418]
MEARKKWVTDAVEILRRESRRAVGKPIIRSDGLSIDWVLDYEVNNSPSQEGRLAGQLEYGKESLSPAFIIEHPTSTPRAASPELLPPVENALESTVGHETPQQVPESPLGEELDELDELEESVDMEIDDIPLENVHDQRNSSQNTSYSNTQWFPKGPRAVKEQTNQPTLPSRPIVVPQSPSKSPTKTAVPVSINVPSQTCRTAFIPQVPPGMTSQDLKAIFESILGPKRPVDVLIPPNNRSIAYVYFDSSENAELALRHCDGKRFPGAPIRLKRYKTVAQGLIPSTIVTSYRSPITQAPYRATQIIPSRSEDGPSAPKRLRTDGPTIIKARPLPARDPTSHAIDDEEYSSSSSSDMELESQSTPYSRERDKKLHGGEDPISKSLISISQDEPSHVVTFPMPINTNPAVRGHVKARRLLLASDVVIAVAMRGEVEFIDRNRRERKTQWSLPRRSRTKYYVVDASIVGDHHAVVGYYNSRFQASLIDFTDKPKRIHLDHRPHTTDPEGSLRGVTALCDLHHISDDSVRFASGGYDRAIYLWSVELKEGTIRTTKLPDFHKSHIRALAYNGHRKQLFSGGADRRFCVFDVEAEKIITDEKLNAKNIINQLHVHPDRPNYLFWEVENQEQILIFDIRTDLSKPQATLGPPYSLYAREKPLTCRVRGSCYLDMFLRRGEIYDIRNNRQVINVKTPDVHDIYHTIVDTRDRTSILQYGKSTVSYFDFHLLNN